MFLSPSVTAQDGDSEGGAPVSIIEAQATGMPIVSTVHADIPEAVVPGESALLSAERDVDGLAENLAQVVAEPGKWEAMVGLTLGIVQLTGIAVLVLLLIVAPALLG